MRLRTALAANLKRIRLAAKLSKEELAHRADMDRTYVSSLERGNYAATVDMLERIRSEEHTSELQSLMRISYAVFCLKKKTTKTNNKNKLYTTQTTNQ